MAKSIQSLNDAIFKNYLKEALWGFPIYAINRRPTAPQNVKRRRISMTMIRPSLDAVYEICRGLPSAQSLLDLKIPHNSSGLS